MERTRVVLDTTVLVSAIVFGGRPRIVLEMVFGGDINCSLSFAILDELRDVLQRPKFGFSPRQSVTIIDELHTICDILNPPRRIRTIKVDPDDNRVLECAVEAQADSIISGDAHLLDLGEYRGIAIMSPSEFLNCV